VTLSSHFPYVLIGDEEGWSRARRLRRTTGGGRGFRPLYLRMMSYVDRELGVLFEGLEARGLLEDTYVIVYSDHRGRMEARARYHEGLASPAAARLAAFIEQHHVPCLILGPGIEPARIETHSSHLDIAPTVLELAGLDVPEAMMGRSLLTPCTCRVWALPTLTDAVVLAGPGRLGCYSMRDRRLALYDEVTGDPFEAGSDEELRYRAMISRALFSEWVFMREGRRVEEAGRD
jgi:membrane-anchored protein YejM (alkaline phosphatase superfamily)